jgi:hypothetical protein
VRFRVELEVERFAVDHAGDRRYSQRQRRVISDCEFELTEHELALRLYVITDESAAEPMAMPVLVVPFDVHDRWMKVYPQPDELDEGDEG